VLQLADLREFAACVRGKKDPDFSPEHDLAVQEALLRACGMAGPSKYDARLPRGAGEAARPGVVWSVASVGATKLSP
jgi:hypothetical protein